MIIIRKEMFIMILDYERIMYVGFLLSQIKDCIGYIVRIDPQFWAISDIVDKVRSGIGAVAIIMNALVSYRLVMPGEEYWSVFSREFISSSPSFNNIIQWFKLFLKKYNPLTFEYKISRLRKFAKTSVFSTLFNEPDIYCYDIDILNSALGKIYKDPNAKTVLFSTKMYYYYCIAKGLEPMLDFNIPLPIDRRIAKLTYMLGLLIECRKRKKQINIDLLMNKYRLKVFDAWNYIAMFSGIPPLILDTIMWVISGNYLGEKTISRILNKYCIDNARRVLKSLYTSY